MDQVKKLWGENTPLTRELHLSKKDEKVVWQDFLAGDQAAISYIYRNYARNLYNYGRQYTKHEIVMDCIQDLFYDLIRLRKNLKSVNSLKAYLYASLRRKIFRQTQKLKNEIEQSLSEEQNSFKIAQLADDSQLHEQLDRDNKKILEAACNKLPPRQREIILLYFFEEMSYQDISQVMNFGDVTSARTLVHRAITSLRKKLI